MQGRTGTCGGSVKTWSRDRQIAVSVWAFGAVMYVAVRGVPFDRLSQALIIISAAIVFAVGTEHKWQRTLKDWLPFFGLLFAYDFTRGLADNTGRHVLVDEMYHHELSWFGRFFGGVIPSVWLQDHLFDPNHIAWWESLVALMYCSHFVVPWLLVGILYVRNRDSWVLFARRVIAISIAALITYVLVPAAPPWYASRQGLCEPLFRIVTRGWQLLGVPAAGELVSLGQGMANDVAALPSLHAGMTATISLYFWPRVRRSVRPFLIVYMLFMLFTLVYGAEHYVIDALVGFAYAVLVEFGCRTWEKRRAAPDRSDRAVRVNVS